MKNSLAHAWRAALIALMVVFGGAMVVPTLGCQKDAGDHMEDAGENLKEAGEDVGDAVKDATEEAGDKIEEGLDKAGDKIEDATDGHDHSDPNHTH